MRRRSHPHFLVIGAQKAGTSTLHRVLQRHPQLHLPEKKELQYFTLHGDRPWAWYQEQFAQAGEDRLTGEVTPYYLFHPEAAARIRAALPQVRLVALLRDPVERALSQYFHARRHGFESLPLAEALAAEASRLEGAEAALRQPGARHYSHQKHSYLARSRYELQLERYDVHFPADQLLVLQSEPLLAGDGGSWSRLLSFLGVDTLGVGSLQGKVALPRENAGRREAAAVEAGVRESLRRELAATVAAVRERYGFDWGW